MERRHIIFIILAVLVLGTHFALLQWLGPPKKPPVAKKDGDKAAQKDEAADKAGKAVPKAKEPPEAERHGGNLNPKRWSASGYGQTDPIVANDTPEGRGKNRRVELVLMPDVEEMLDLKSLL